MTTETIHVTVTQDMIDRGKRCSQEYCPVADALLEATGQIWFVTGGHFWTEGNHHCYPPDWLRDKIIAFDRMGVPMEPFSFEMRWQPYQHAYFAHNKPDRLGRWYIAEAV